MRIERDTRTDIKIPRQGQEGDITIFGSTAAVSMFPNKYFLQIY